jgi:hypothetical protein
VNTCETCAHWADDWHDEYDDPALGLRDDNGEPLHNADFSMVRAEGTWGHCTKVDMFGPRKASKFYVVDGSEYVAALYTRSDFGCTEWEPRVIADDLPSGPNPGIGNPDFETSTEGWR